MKPLNLFFITIFWVGLMQAHIQESEGGMFWCYQDLKRMQGKEAKTAQQVFFEKKNDESDSNVFDIRNKAQFELFVIKNSMFKPVALKIYKSDLPISTDFKASTKVFQDVADVFSANVVFAGLDLTKNNGYFSTVLKFKNEDLPLIIFFENGRPQFPYVPANQHKNYLVKMIETRFFKK